MSGLLPGFLLLLALGAGSHPVIADDELKGDAAARELADKMLERLGGREAWAGLRNTINGSQQNRAGEPTVVYAVITMDFEQPRFRIETTSQDLHLIRVIDGENSWRLRRSGKIEDVLQVFGAEYGTEPTECFQLSQNLSFK